MNKTNTPKISIGLPTYNGEKFLCEAIDSVLNQTFRDFELILCDNASTDQTESICRRYAEQDSRVRYHRNPTNIGGANNANLTVQLAQQSQYFLYFADDDVLERSYLEKCFTFLEGHPNILLCYPQLIDIDDHGNQLRITIHELGLQPDPYKRFVSLIDRGHYCEAIYGLIRLDVLRQTRLEQNYSHSDRTLLCELALNGQFYQLQEPLFYKRLHQRNIFLDHYSRMAWFDSSYIGKIVFPAWRQFFDYFVTINRTQISWKDKLRCNLFMCGPYIRDYGPRMVKDIVFAIYMLLKPAKWRKQFYKQRDNWSSQGKIDKGSTGIDWLLDKRKNLDTASTQPDKKE